MEEEQVIPKVNNEKTIHDSNNNGFHSEGKGDSTPESCNTGPKVTEDGIFPSSPEKKIGSQDDSKSDTEGSESESESSEVESSKQASEGTTRNSKRLKPKKVTTFQFKRGQSIEVLKEFFFKDVSYRKNRIFAIRVIQEDKHKKMEIQPPECYSEPFIRLIVDQDSSITLECSFLPEGGNPSHLSKVEAHWKIKLVTFKRKDEYTKKLSTALKTSIYKEVKKGGVQKGAAHKKIKKEYCIIDENTFNNMFNSDTKKGLRESSISYILLNDYVFNKILTKRRIKNVVTEMNTQTDLDVETNIMDKLEDLTLDKIPLFGPEGFKMTAVNFIQSHEDFVAKILTKETICNLVRDLYRKTPDLYRKTELKTDMDIMNKFKIFFKKQPKEHGLKQIIVNFIQSHESELVKIFTKKTISNVKEDLDRKTDSEIENSIIDKCEQYFNKKDLPIEFRFNKLSHDLSSERSFKKPFTYDENQLAVIPFLALFIKGCTKNIEGLEFIEEEEKLMKQKSDIEKKITKQQNKLMKQKSDIEKKITKQQNKLKEQKKKKTEKIKEQKKKMMEPKRDVEDKII